MSYILDALRRADSERERERSAVPGLHTQASPAGVAEGEVDAPSHPWKWPIAAAFVALLGLVAWLWFGRAEAPEPLVAAPLTRPPVPAAPPPAPPPAAPPVTAPAAAAPPPVAVASATAPGESAPATARKPPAPTPVAKRPATATAAAPKVVAKASEPEVKISALNELPDEVRRELPAITVGGSIYSKSSANRMLVINGQVFHEGDELATGLVLEQIRQKSAVLKFKTYRYEITY